MRIIYKNIVIALVFAIFSLPMVAQVVDKVAAVVGNEMISLSEIEQELRMMRIQQGNYGSNLRCELLEQMLENKLFLAQARVDSLTINADMVQSNLNQRLDQLRSQLGGDEGLENYFGKSIYKLRADWQKMIEDMNLSQQSRSKVAGQMPPMTPYDVKHYMDTLNVENADEIPITYRLSQIVIYPDVEAAKLAVKEKLISMRERILNGEKFSTLARLYSEDTESARRGGELGLASKSIFWPAFSDAAMSLRPGVISQVVETPDGFHIIEVIEKKGDMFNARHILIRPQYTLEDSEKAFARLDSIAGIIKQGKIKFAEAARYYSEDLATMTNGGQMADPNTGSTYFEIDRLKPVEYKAIQNLKEGEISEPFESTDNDGRDNGLYIRGKTCYKIIRVDKILPAHKVNIKDDYSLLQERAEYSLQLKEISKFLDEKIETTYIYIDSMFKDCRFKRKKWSSKFE